MVNHFLVNGYTGLSSGLKIYGAVDWIYTHLNNGFYILEVNLNNSLIEALFWHFRVPVDAAGWRTGQPKYTL